MAKLKLLTEHELKQIFGPIDTLKPLHQGSHCKTKEMVKNLSPKNRTPAKLRNIQWGWKFFRFGGELAGNEKTGWNYRMHWPSSAELGKCERTELLTNSDFHQISQKHCHLPAKAAKERHN